jgi:hypothetical protein
MPETPSNPPPSPQKAPPGIPAIDPNAIMATVLAVLKTPVDFYKSIKDEKGFQKPVMFSVIMYAVYGVCSMVWPIIHGWATGAVTALVLAVVMGVIAPFLGGIIVWAVCMAFGSKATWERAVPIAGYATAAMLGVGIGVIVPGIGWVIQLVSYLYGLYLCFVGARTLMFEPTPDAKPAA